MPVGCKMAVAVWDTRGYHIVYQFIAFVHYLIDIALARGEATACRIGAGKVGSVVGVGFGAGIDHHKTIRVDKTLVRVAVEDFAVLREYGLKARSKAAGKGYAFHFSDYLLLDAAQPYASAGGGVHCVSEVAGSVNMLNFNIFLNQTHFNYRAGEGLGCYR